MSRWFQSQGMKGPLVCLGWLLLVVSGWAAPMSQDVYVWQRAWTDPVRTAVREHGGDFGTVVVLAAEVDWHGDRPEAVRVPLDYGVLKDLRRSRHTGVGLALRIGPYHGAFVAGNPADRYLTALARSLVNEAETNGLTPDEFQIDFDSAESKLDGYRVWVEGIRQAMAPVPARITVLPVWLKHPGFAPLARAAGGFILQVHSLQRPHDLSSPFTICDPAAAREAVRQAATVGIPFRVALPTYGYLVAFTLDGKFLGLSAEGPAKNWPSGATLREVRSDPKTIAPLVQEWAAHRPASLAGIIWYRFPVPDDVFNWRWPTLRAMLALQTPRASVQALARPTEPGLVEIRLQNDGELDVNLPFALTARWSNARLVASDALAGFGLARTGAGSVEFKSGPAGVRLSPGDNRLIGWLRFDGKAEVRIEKENF